MTRIVAFSLVAAVLLGSGVCLGIEQTQETQIETGDHLWLQLGSQSGDAISNLAILTEQLMEGVCGQSLIAHIGAVGQASSQGAEIGVLRSLGITSWQGQLVAGPCAAKREDQNLHLHGLLSLGMDNGPGDAHGSQQFVVRGDQGGGNFTGTMDAGASTLGLQSTSLSGFARPLDGVEATMQVDTIQSQFGL